MAALLAEERGIVNAPMAASSGKVMAGIVTIFKCEIQKSWQFQTGFKLTSAHAGGGIFPSLDEQLLIIPLVNEVFTSY
jgi:hypothetical protein